MNSDRRTLVVSLDPALIQQVRGALEPKMATVVAAPTGAAALDEVREREYGLAIVSADLPDRDGFQITTELKTLSASLPVLLVGPDPDGKATERAHAAGAIGFVHTPLRASALIERLEDLLGTGWFAPSSGAGSLPRGAASLVDPGSGVFGAETGYSVSVLEDDGVEVVSGASQTQDLPSLAVEAFDPDHPVSVPVGADVTAHGIPALRKDKPDVLEERALALLAPGGPLRGQLEALVREAVRQALSESDR